MEQACAESARARRWRGLRESLRVFLRALSLEIGLKLFEKRDRFVLIRLGMAQPLCIMAAKSLAIRGNFPDADAEHPTRHNENRQIGVVGCIGGLFGGVKEN